MLWDADRRPYRTPSIGLTSTRAAAESSSGSTGRDGGRGGIIAAA
jgi:hypothetical protein